MVNYQLLGKLISGLPKAVALEILTPEILAQISANDPHLDDFYQGANTAEYLLEHQDILNLILQAKERTIPSTAHLGYLLKVVNEDMSSDVLRRLGPKFLQSLVTEAADISQFDSIYQNQYRDHLSPILDTISDLKITDVQTLIQATGIEPTLSINLIFRRFIIQEGKSPDPRFVADILNHVPITVLSSICKNSQVRDDFFAFHIANHVAFKNKWDTSGWE